MSGCIFCKIINGEIPSYTLYENEDFKVILDRFPAAQGHALIVPKKHFDDIYAFDPRLAGGLFQLTMEMAARLKDKLGCAGLNILQNNGEVAGQTVKHLHVHLIPRYDGDGMVFNYTPADPSEDEFKELVVKITG